MFRFDQPIFLWLLLIVPMLALLRFWSWRQRVKNLRHFGDPILLRELMPDVSKYRPSVKFWLLEAAIALMVLLLARPQMGTKISREKRNGIETIICLDISNSMLAQDVTPSRLQKSKMLVENLVDHFTNDKIGLIVFAGDAFVQLPITSDYVSAKMFLQNIDPSLIDMQGTDLARALQLATSSFTQQEGIGRAIIVITDGEDHEGGALEAAKEARKKGLNVFILGVGNAAGCPIPDGQGGYLRDELGEVVMTALNESMCREVAQAGSGQYIHVDNTSDAQEDLNDELARLQRGDTESVIYSEYDEQFQAFAIIVLLLLMIEACILESKNPVTKRWALFKKGSAGKAFLLITMMLFLPLALSAQADRQHIRQGNKLYRSENYAKAEVEYQKAVGANDRNPRAHYNLGCALMMQQKDSAAVTHFENAGKLATEKSEKAQIYHNIGWICQKHQMFGEAIEAYEESLRNNPSDDETRYNLALCQRQQKKQQQQGGGNNDEKKQQKKEQQKQEKQDQQKEQKQQQPREQMSKENAEQLLNAALQDEKATQQRMKKSMQHSSRRQLKKNW